MRAEGRKWMENQVREENEITGYQRWWSEKKKNVEREKKGQRSNKKKREVEKQRLEVDGESGKVRK